MSEVDRVHPGGLMRCCLETLRVLYPDGPASVAHEGDKLHCQYAEADNDLHKMRFKDGYWEWDHD